MAIVMRGLVSLAGWAWLALTASAFAQAPAAGAPAIGGAGATAPPPAAAEAPALPAEHRPKLQVTLSPQKAVQTGDVLHLRIEAETEIGDELAVPEQRLGPFELRAKRAKVDKTSAGRQRHVFELDLLALDPGERELPAVELRVVTKNGLVGTVATEPMRVRVSSVLGNEPNAKLKPATKPVSVMQDDYTVLYVLGGLAAAALVAIATLFASRWWRRREKKVPPPPPPRPAWEVALERLVQLELEKTSYLKKAEGAALVDRISDVLREYLGARFGGGALVYDGLETTSDEMLAILRQRGVPTDVLREVSDFLFHCDLIKFAKVAATEQEADELLANGRKLISSTTPPPPAPAAVTTPGTDSNVPSS